MAMRVVPYDTTAALRLFAINATAMASGETDSPGKIPRTSAEYEQVHRTPPASEFEKTHKPYSPLPPGERLPTMAENWRRASTRTHVSLFTRQAACFAPRSRAG